MEDYSAAIKLNPKDPFKYYARALAYLEQGSYSPAMEDLTKAIQLKNNYEDFYLKRAYAYMQTGKYKLALNDLKKVKKTDTRALQAQAYYELRDYRTAQDLFEELEKQNPQDTQTLLYLGKSGNVLKFGYRESYQDLARPAFSNEISYDLTESDIIGYKKAKLQVISATNTSITYKVLSYFNDEF